MSSTTPRPGSTEARNRGCTCPVVDQNDYGTRIVTGGCPLHAPGGDTLIPRELVYPEDDNGIAE